MQNVSKKKPRKGIGKRKGALLLLLCIALAAAGVYVLRRPLVLPPPADNPVKEALLSRPVEEIAAVTVETQADRFTLIRKEAGFRLLGRESMELQQSAVDAMLNVCGEWTAEKTVLDVGEEPVNLADFSLEPPLLRVAVSYLDGTEAALWVGAVTPDDIPQRYCMKAGDGRIFSVLADDAEPFFREQEALRAFTQPSLRADLVDRITVSGDMDIDMHYTPSGWLLDQPIRYPLDKTRVDALLQKIENMGFDAYLGDAGEVELADWGLASPDLRVTLTQGATVVTGETQDGESFSVDVPPQTFTLALGRSSGESALYVLWEGGVYRASRFVLGFWQEIDVDRLLLREPVNFLVNDLNRVSVTAQDKEAAYTVEMVESITQNNQIATDEYGRVLYDAEVRRAGEKEPMDAETFLAWYQRLAALRAAGAVPGDWTVNGDPRCRIVIENDNLRREIAFVPYDDLHSAMLVDGVCRFYVSNAALQSLIDDLP